MSSPSSSGSRDEQLVATLTAPPPRTLSRELRQAALGQAAPLSFAVFGALFGGFSLLIVWVFFPWNIVRDWQLLRPDTVQTNGTIFAAAESPLLRKTHVVAYAFEFRTTAGVLRRGECFTTGWLWQAGDRVQVLYRRDQPSIACPMGARSSLTGASSMFVALFPLAGAGLMLWVTLSRRRMLNTFSNGRVLEAFVTDIEHTQTMVNDYSVFKITFERADAPRDPPIILRNWKPKVVSFLQVRKEAKQPVLLLCDPRKPKNILLPETL